MVFPVIHSTLDPAALTEEVARRYGFDDGVRCRLISRANNDFYQVAAGGQRFALRVAKANFRPPEDYGYELGLLAHLDAAGARVPGPVPLTTDGALYFTVEAPEGLRTVALFKWLDGTPFAKTLTRTDARDMGAALAVLHRAGQGYRPAYVRRIGTVAYLTQNLPQLLAMMAGRPADRDFYAQAAAAVSQAYDLIDVNAVPRGPVHGDFQYANVMRMADGGIGALDFDTCGEGYLAQDISTFVWRADMDIGDEGVVAAFVAGYDSVRPLSAGERAALPLFRAARDLVMAVTYAILINRVGPVPGFDGDFAPFTALARRHLAEAGLSGP